MIDLTPLDVRKKRGDFGKGLRSFKKGVKEDEPEPVEAKDVPSSATASTVEAQSEKD